jgi:uncharacterized protein
MPTDFSSSFRPGESARCDTSRHRALARLLVLGFLTLGFLAAPRPGRAETVDQVAAQAKATGYVTDLAGVLSQPGKDQLIALCTEVAQKAQAEIAVVTIRSLDGRPKEDYSHDLAERLGLGPKGAGRGVLILFAIDDHQYRIDVGYALEPILPDGKVGGFGREAVPYLRQNNYDAAILLVTQSVANVIAADRGVTLSGPRPAPPPANSEDQGRMPPGAVILVILAFLVFLGIMRILRRAMFGPGRYPRGGGGWWIGPMIGGGWGGGGFGGGGGGGGFGGFGGGGFGSGGGFGGGGAGGSW